MIFFSQETGFDISCKLSPQETICIKYQTPFSGKNKNISKCHLLKNLPGMLSVKGLIQILCFACWPGALLFAWNQRYILSQCISFLFTALNDSKYIGFCIYNVIIICAFGVPLTHVLPTEETTLNFVLLSALVMFCTTMCLCILFVPKVTIVFRVWK